MLKRMRIRCMTDVMKEDGCHCSLALFRTYRMTFGLKVIQGQLHQIRGAKSMVEAMMVRPWIYQAAEPQLSDASKPLKIRVLKKVED